MGASGSLGYADGTAQARLVGKLRARRKIPGYEAVGSAGLPSLWVKPGGSYRWKHPGWCAVTSQGIHSAVSEHLK